jgi:hypothetical protein
MDTPTHSQTPAEVLPSLYREVLETVSRLERAGQRNAAWEIRRKALVAYSTHWDSQGKRALERLNRDARQLLASKHVAAAAALSTGTEPA